MQSFTTPERIQGLWVKGARIKPANKAAQIVYFGIMKEHAAHISINPEIRFGKPCIKGTRIAVVDILGWLSAGMTNQEIMDDFPPLTEEHIRAALAFAANREAMIKLVAA